MIVAGIGCRKGVSTAEVIAAVETALEAHGLAGRALSALATTGFKREEKAIFAAGHELGLPVIVVDDESPSPDGAVAADTLTHSELSQTIAGVPSVSEAAALGAAGAGARLCGPRIVVGPVTCALATTEDAA